MMFQCFSNIFLVKFSIPDSANRHISAYSFQNVKFGCSTMLQSIINNEHLHAIKKYLTDCGCVAVGIHYIDFEKKIQIAN